MDQKYYPDRVELEEAYARKLTVYEAVLEDFVRRLGHNLKEQGVRFSLKSRVKSFSSYYKKLLRKIGQANSSSIRANIQDILGIRIVCPFLENLQSVEEILRSHYTLFEVERKGAEHSFREFGYQSIHLLLELPAEVRDHYADLDIAVCEVQIRTILQDAWSEVEHELVYKANFTPYDESLRRKLAALNANLSLSDVIFQEIRDYQRSLHTELKKRRRSFAERVETETSGTSVKPRKESPEADQNRNSSFANVDQLLLKALNAHNRGDFYGAIQLYDEILERQIDSGIRSVITVHRGMALFAASRYSEALENFLSAAELEPDNNKVYYYQGIVYRVLDRPTEALAAFSRSLEIYPYHLESLFSLAQTYFKLEDFPAALEYCEKALKIAPEEEKVINLRGYINEKMSL
ncbi:MAG: tetratricopeptide repeat protein [Spirochaetota bacterium]